MKIFKTYSKKAYADVEKQFNNDINIVEKRAILVALHKIGIPIDLSTKDVFDINNICFEDKRIDKDEIDGMILQIDKGHCDSLFFMDIESYFTSNLRLTAVRNVAKKFVKQVLSESALNINTSPTIIYPNNWTCNFTLGELQTIAVFAERLANAYYFATDNKPDIQKINVLIKEVEIGLWDNYLFWDLEAYQNMKAQSGLANTVQQVMSNNPMTILPPQTV